MFKLLIKHAFNCLLIVIRSFPSFLPPIDLLASLACLLHLLACLLACLLTYLLAYRACLLTYLLTCSLACLFAYLLAYLLTCLLACLLVCLLTYNYCFSFLLIEHNSSSNLHFGRVSLSGPQVDISIGSIN